MDFYHHLNLAGASLYEGDSTQAVLFEEPYEGRVGKTGPCWKQDTRVVCEYHTLKLSAMGVYSFRKSGMAYHMELETDKRIRDSSGVPKSELEILLEHATNHGKGLHSLPHYGSKLDHPFIRVAHHDSLHFQELFEGVRLDAPKIIRTINQLADEGDPCIAKKGDRNTKHINLGFGTQSHDDKKMAASGERRKTSNLTPRSSGPL